MNAAIDKMVDMLSDRVYELNNNIEAKQLEFQKQNKEVSDEQLLSFKEMVDLRDMNLQIQTAIIGYH